VVLAVLDPRLIFTPTTPTGGDLGAHVMPFSFAVERLLSAGRLAGWNPGWFAGFPIITFYFPLPALLAGVLVPPLGFPVALKVVCVLGPLLLPFSAFALARGMGFGRFEAGWAAVFGGAFLFMESYWHLGGNLYSTLVGEFAFTLSFALSIFFIGMVSSAFESPRARRGPAALVLASTALTHVLSTLAAVLASVPLLARRGTRVWIVAVWSLGFALAAFWAVPFLVRSSHMGHLPWVPSTSLRDLMPLELWFVAVPALAGLVAVTRKGPAAAPFLTLMAVSVVIFVIPTGLEMRDRFLPFWYFGVHFAAGLALGRGLVAYMDSRSTRGLAGAIATLALLTGLFVIRDARSVRTAATWSLEGYEGKQAWPELEEFIVAVRSLPPGRVLAQRDTVLAPWGTLHAPAALPYWSPGHGSLTGLWTESSPTAPFALQAQVALSPDFPASPFRGMPGTGYDPDAGVAQMAFLGARFYAAFSEDARARALEREDLRIAARGAAFTVFETAVPRLVTVATREPVVYEGMDWSTAAVDWFARYERLDEWLAVAGPPEWDRRRGRPIDWPPATRVGDVGAVVSVEDQGDRIEFVTTAIGVPHLVRVSHFPNWHVEGADGPFLAAPSFMIVVPRRSDVALEFRDTWVEWTGRALTLLGLCALVGTGVYTRLHEARRPGPERAGMDPPGAWRGGD
jgi:hypothetical protein